MQNPFRTLKTVAVLHWLKNWAEIVQRFKFHALVDDRNQLYAKDERLLLQQR
jgi:hypothetical protein